MWAWPTLLGGTQLLQFESAFLFMVPAGHTALPSSWKQYDSMDGELQRGTESYPFPVAEVASVMSWFLFFFFNVFYVTEN